MPEKTIIREVEFLLINVITKERRYWSKQQEEERKNKKVAPRAAAG